MHCVTRSFHFCAGHRILGHAGKCKHLHGHNYVALVTVARKEYDSGGVVRGPGCVNDMGMVIDFGDLKCTVGQWIQDNWDHNMILFLQDPLAIVGAREPSVFGGRVPYLMPVDEQPTAENMAAALARVAQNLLGGEFRIVSVKIRETPDCAASYTPSE